MSSIGILGGGYVGLTTAAGFASLGHDVVVLETDEKRRECIASGHAPFFEPGLDELVAEEVGSGRLKATSIGGAPFDAVEFLFICLPTPQMPDGSADLSYVFGAIDDCRALLKPGSIVVSKSTVPVGTARHIIRRLARSDVAVVANPEFLQEGAAVKAFLEAERIVIGSDDPGTADRVAALYGGVDAQVHSIGLESAELAKYACNSFLSTKLSFVNSISALCELAGADVEEVVAVMGSDSRIGSQFLRPGPGWGGSCFPKDLAALAHNSAELGFGFPLLEAVVEANEATFARVVNHVAEVVGVLQGSQVAVWGLAFKAGTSDVRNSPALTICRRLIGLGARVVAFDPLVKEVEGIELASSMYEACEGADALVVLTEWEEFSRADLRQVAKAAPGAVVIDTRAVIGLAEAADAGLEVWRLGRPRGGGGTDVG